MTQKLLYYDISNFCDIVSNETFPDFGHDPIDKEPDGRYRTFMVLAYPDNPEQNEWVTANLPKLELDYVGVLHDKDSCKPHYHIVFYFKDARWFNAVVQLLGVDSRWLRCWNSKTKAFKYLLHRGWKHKFQYSDDSLFGTLTDDCISVCNRGLSSEQEGDQIEKLLRIVDSFESYISIKELTSLVLENHLWSVFRRSASIVFKIVDAHNAEVESRTSTEISVQRITDEMLTHSNSLSFDERCDALERKGIHPLPLD